MVGLVRSIVSEHGTILLIVIRQKILLKNLQQESKKNKFSLLILPTCFISDYADTLKQLLAEQTQSLVDMIENVVQKVMSDVMQPNYFIVRAVQNSLIQDLLASFNCVICQNVAQPAVTVGTCCERVLGCQPGIDTWFQSQPIAQSAERKMGQVKYLY